MRRRGFIIVILTAAFAVPLPARAQQSAMPVVAFMHSGSARTNEFQVKAFREGLARAGFAEGRDVMIEYHWVENRMDRLPALAADLVRRRVAVIAACGSPLVALAAKSATATIPIVFENGADPVQLGLVQSLNHPGGNITGITNSSGDLAAKRMGLLRELVPSAAAIAVLVNPNRPGVDTQLAQVQAAARSAGLPLHVLKAASEHDLEAEFSTLPRLGVVGLVVSADAFFTERRDQIIALAKRHAIPTIYEFRYFVMDGGLVSYGSDNPEAYRQAGSLAGRILKGEKPGDLPVIRPTKFELVINMKTARALGLEVPISMQLLADEVIE